MAASGRQYPNLRRVFGPVQDEIGYVCENGCLAFWENRKIHKALMEQGLAHELIRAALELSGAEVLISGNRFPISVLRIRNITGISGMS